MKRKTEVTDFHDRDSSAWKKFILLVWKNYIIQKRHNIQTIVEITLPLLFTCLLLVIRVVIKLDVVTEPTIFPAFPVEIDSLEDLNFTCENEALFGFKPCLVAFTPNTSEIIELMGEVGSKLDVTAKGYQSEADMISELMGTTSSKKSSSNKSPRKPSSPRDATARSFGDGVCDPLGNNTDIFQDLLENFVTNRTIQGSFRAGVVFNVTSFSNQTHIQMSLRFRAVPYQRSNPLMPTPTWMTDLLYPRFQTPGPRSEGDPYGGEPGYYEEGFLLLQHTIFKEIANFWNSAGLNSTEEQNSSWPSEDDLQVYLQRMPYPPYVDDTFLVALGGWLPLVLMLSFIYPAANISKSITHEKEKRLKESMKMMGLPNWQHWLAWFVKSFLFLLIAVILMTIILVVKAYKAPNGTKLAVLDKSDPFLVFCFLVTYALATIAFAFLVSTIFSKANSASTWSGLLWFLTYIPFTFLDPRYEQLSLNLKLSTSIFVNMAMAFAGKIIGLFEGAGKGVRWETLWEPVSPDDDLSFGHIMLMFLVDIVLYLLIAWYLDAVFPGSYGVPQKWYFPFQKSYWLGIKEKPIEEATSALRARPDLFEEDPRHLKPGIRIINLSKIYKGEKLAVNGMNLNMYEGQITVLLGHNGAGKTTTMSMLTGLYPPTSGTALVSNHDIRTDIGGVRKSLGLCPQHDVLFDELTVEEHLIFFCKLKGLPNDEVKGEVDKMIRAVGLEDKRHMESRTLSGGMKRKLSVGIALCAHSKIVMLDEPTSGMDPSARRATWDLLQKERRGRTMLLTTHFMDEADLLGDRIAIMSEGDLKCVGSSIFLKKKFGAGYHMVAVKEPWCDVSRVTEVIQRHVPDGSLDQNVGAELTFLLPDNCSPRFPSMFTELENRKGDLGISSFGVSVTTMEEVFIRVGESSNPLLKDQMSSMNQKANLKTHDTNGAMKGSATTLDEGLEMKGMGSTSHILEVAGNEETPLLERANKGLTLYAQQMYAMLVKKFLNFFRNKALSITQVLTPVFFLVIALVVAKTFPGVEDSRPLLISLQPYRNPQVTAGREEDVAPFLQGVFDTYLNYLRADFGEEVYVPVNETVEDFLIEKGKEDVYSYNLRYVMGSTFVNQTVAVALFNGRPLHSPPLTLSGLENAILKTLFNWSFSISVVNHPLPLSEDEELEELRETGGASAVGFQVGFNLAFGMSFLVSGMVIFLVRERMTKSKHLQYASGLRFWLYWASAFIWDFAVFMVTVAGIYLVFVLFKEDGFTKSEEQVRILLLFAAYGFAVIPMTYLTSFLFTIPSTGYTRMSMFNIFTGVAALLTVVVLQIPDLDLVDVADTLEWVFLILPNFDLGIGINYLYSNGRINELCPNSCMDLEIPLIDDGPLNLTLEECCECGLLFNLSNPCCGPVTGFCGNNMPCLDWSTNFFALKKPGVGRMVLACVFLGVFFFFLLFLIEIKFLPYIYNLLKDRLVYRGRKELPSEEELEDEDVARERSRILQTPKQQLFQSDSLILHNLTKFYDDFLAVDRLCLGVPKGECFGLLGINGAGKTTTFKMITGDEPISHGDVYLDQFSVRRDVKSVQQRLGYCPQFDALIDHMSVEETLWMFSRLKGIPESNIRPLAESLISDLLLQAHCGKLVRELSGGNKRKLSTGVALIGDPPITFLDEPTTGMDPVARRLLWDSIARVRDSGQSIILTSHSMDECEALCTRLVIMVNGRFQCLGSPQHLKGKFGQGYTLIVKLKPENLSRETGAVRPSTTASVLQRWSSSAKARGRRSSSLKERVDEEPTTKRLHQYVMEKFPGSILKDYHRGLVTYQVIDPSLNWSRIFQLMESAKDEFHIQDYSVGQTTLEQVFLNFAQGQRESDES